MTPASSRVWIRSASALVLGVAAICLASTRPALAQTNIGQVPNLQFQSGRTAMLAGNYEGALESYEDGLKGAIRGADSRWVDSAAFLAMIGECHYQQGNLPKALQSFDAAIKLFNDNSNWMLKIDFPVLIEPAPVAGVATPWGAPVEAVIPGRFAERYNMIYDSLGMQGPGLGNGNNFLMAQRQAIPIRCAEIVRAMCTAIRHRRQILGPLSEHDPNIDRLVNALKARPAPPNHWSQCWIEVQLGCAYAALGKPAQAVGELTKSLKSNDVYYHPLTATAFNELGQLALEEGKYDQAGTCFMEATYVAAQFGIAEEMEEAFRGAQLAWLLAGTGEPFAPLVPAGTWAKKSEYRALHASLLLLAGENLNLLGRTAEADAILQQAQKEIKDMTPSKFNARLQLEQARLAFASGNQVAGVLALTPALKFQQSSSPWLFQITMATKYHTDKAFSDRAVDMMYSQLLRDPTGADWAIHPFDTLAVSSSDYTAAYQKWMEVLITRKDYDRALEVADRMKRHRFYASLPLGGRLPALRAVLESPVTALSPRTQTQRTLLLQNYPGYQPLMTKADEIRGALHALPLMPEDRAQKEQQTKLLQELTKVSEEQETILRNMAVRREAADFIMPPAVTLAEVRKRMNSRQLMLYYASTSTATHGFALTKDKLSAFQVGTPTKLKAEVAKLLKDMGNLDKNGNVPAETIAGNNWKAIAKGLLKTLSNNAKDDSWSKYEEVIVVPDGALWYLPFECLVAGDGSDAPPLIAQTRVRYAPTLGLSLPDAIGHRGEGRTAVVTGKLFPRDDVSVAATAFEDLSKATAQAERIAQPISIPAPVYASICDRVVVFQDIEEPSKNPYAWSPLPIDKARKGADLTEWMALPMAGPNLVVLPGFHTAAETAIKKPAAGDDVFLSTCALMSSGTQTLLISRWRPGGKTAVDLVREFVQEQPNMPADAAWQRSVLLAMDSPVAFKDEPRIKSDVKDSAPKATHPFFWAAYCLVDRGSIPGQEPLPAVDIPDDALKPAAAKAAKEDRDDPPADKGGKKPAGKVGEKMPAGEKLPAEKLDPAGKKPKVGALPGEDAVVGEPLPAGEPGKPGKKPKIKPAAKK